LLRKTKKPYYSIQFRLRPPTKFLIHIPSTCDLTTDAKDHNNG
jgi:hypothetical protein